MADKSIDRLLRGLARLLWLFGWIHIPTKKKSDYVATEEQIFQWASVRELSGLEQGLLIDARGDYRSTAIAVGIFVELLWPRAANSQLPTGVVRIQDVLELHDVKDTFEERGISIRDWDRREMLSMKLLGLADQRLKSDTT